MKILERTITLTGGRNGSLKTETSGLELKMAMPVEMGGKVVPGATNPEELFALGYAACFSSSLEYLLKSERLRYKEIKVVAKTSLINNEATGFHFELDVALKVVGIEEAILSPYIEKAKAFCPFSKAIKGNVEVRFSTLA
ncbi:MAG TPA: hypothetical protein DCX17_00340 [Firmicutes bacterium]|jgi:Ohr subfamily peroxiredoxin|nr:hypothetical protein [Bacillota bacterium]